MISPPFLQQNDKITIISPAGKINPVYVEDAIALLQKWGFQSSSGRSALHSFGSFSGPDNERLYDLQQALDDPEVKAIFCSRGGYGTIRLLEQLSFQQFKNYPKWIIGYSDITLLHAAANQQGILSLHSPMCKHLSEWGEDTSALYLKDTLYGILPDYQIPSHPFNKKGQTSGSIYGGNLAILASLRGTNYDFNPENKILFIEDIGEKSYQIERMMYNLKISGILEKISGLIVGQFTGYQDNFDITKTPYQAIYDLIAKYPYPVCFNFPVGHVKENYPIIMGAETSFIVSEKEVSLSFSSK